MIPVSGMLDAMPVHLPKNEAVDPCPRCQGVVIVDRVPRPRKAGERDPAPTEERRTCRDCGWTQ